MTNPLSGDERAAVVDILDGIACFGRADEFWHAIGIRRGTGGALDGAYAVGEQQWRSPEEDAIPTNSSYCRYVSVLLRVGSVIVERRAWSCGGNRGEEYWKREGSEGPNVWVIRDGSESPYSVRSDASSVPIEINHRVLVHVFDLATNRQLVDGDSWWWDSIRAHLPRLSRGVTQYQLEKRREADEAAAKADRDRRAAAQRELEQAHTFAEALARGAAKVR